ncbi:Hypothetical predicted protein [Pelobates cultripes]|uniref:Uncharacterized protein n=1 Tax=Pelobates cultripes TaxID=61616 RepID=A0AAD1VKL4_PELCU|nr:Hypothetical predicted protein [Pelobates cultripes]
MEEIPTMHPPSPAPLNPDTSPVTTAVLRELLADLQKNMLTDIRADLQGLKRQIGNLETASNTNAQQITTLQQAVQKLQQQSYDQRFSMLDDIRRRNHLKIRGIPVAEIPHLLQCLMLALLHPKQAKAVGAKGSFQSTKITKSPC